MPYPENFAVRLIICVVGMCILWLGGSYVAAVFIRHQEFTFSVAQLIVPIVLGVVDSFAWKPKA